MTPPGSKRRQLVSRLFWFATLGILSVAALAIVACGIRFLLRP